MNATIRVIGVIEPQLFYKVRKEWSCRRWLFVTYCFLYINSITKTSITNKLIVKIKAYCVFY